MDGGECYRELDGGGGVRGWGWSRLERKKVKEIILECS
jgi:hypothetical protein